MSEVARNKVPSLRAYVHHQQACACTFICTYHTLSSHSTHTYVRCTHSTHSTLSAHSTHTYVRCTHSTHSTLSAHSTHRAHSTHSTHSTYTANAKHTLPNAVNTHRTCRDHSTLNTCFIRLFLALSTFRTLTVVLKRMMDVFPAVLLKVQEPMSTGSQVSFRRQVLLILEPPKDGCISEQFASTDSP